MEPTTSTFAAELKTYQTGPKSTEPVAKSPDIMADLTNSNPVPTLTAGLQAAPEAVPETPAAPLVKIGDRQFGTVEEAMKYAELELAKATGMQQALDKVGKTTEPPALPKPGFEEELEKQIFVDPKAAIKALYEKSKNDAKTEILEEYTKLEAQKASRQQAEANWKAHWDNFYVAHKDLSENREAVQFITEKNWGVVKDMLPDQANKYIAAEARKVLGLARQTALPTTQLPNTPAVMAGATGNAVTGGPSVTAQKAVDFVNQLKNHQKRSK